MLMDANDWGMRFGMFLGGLVMALVPIGISIGLGVWAWRERQRAQESAADESEGAA